MSLLEYLKREFEVNKTQDFTLTVFGTDDNYCDVYIHPEGKNGITEDYRIQACPDGTCLVYHNPDIKVSE